MRRQAAVPQMIIDGDGHFVEPPGWMDAYLSEAGRELAAIHAPRGTGLDQAAGSIPEMPFGIGDALTPGGLKPGNPRGRTIDEAEPGGWNSTARLEVHDAEDIA